MRYYLIVQTGRHPTEGHECCILCFGKDGLPVIWDEQEGRDRLTELQIAFPHINYELRFYDAT